MQWPRPVLLVDADLSGSSIMPGYFQGRIRHDKGLQPLAIAHSHGQVEERLWEETLPLFGQPTKRVLPGLTSHAAAPAVARLWPALATLLVSLERGGIDVIADLGRITAAADVRDSLLEYADQLIVTTGSRMPDAIAARYLVAERMLDLDAPARTLANMSVLVVGPGRPYSVPEIAHELAVPSVGQIGWDPEIAEMFSIGSNPNGRRYTKSPLVRSLQPTVDAIQSHIGLRRRHLSPMEVHQ
jgi:hypothetical protein